MAGRRARETAVVIPCGAAALAGTLTLPEAAGGLVLFAHGSGSGQRSLRNRHVAAVLVDGGLATLLLDLLTADLAMLGHQMVAAVDWSAGQPCLEQLPLGLHGSSTGAAAVLQAAAIRPDRVRSVVCRSGRSPWCQGPPISSGKPEPCRQRPNSAGAGCRRPFCSSPGMPGLIRSSQRERHRLGG